MTIARERYDSCTEIGPTVMTIARENATSEEPEEERERAAPLKAGAALPHFQTRYDGAGGTNTGKTLGEGGEAGQGRSPEVFPVLGSLPPLWEWEWDQTKTPKHKLIAIHPAPAPPRIPATRATYACPGFDRLSKCCLTGGGERP